MRLPSVTYSYAVSHPTPVARFVTVAWLQVSINPWLAVILKDKGDSNQYSPAYPTFTFWYQKPYRNSVGGTQSASIESFLNPTTDSYRSITENAFIQHPTLSQISYTHWCHHCSLCNNSFIAFCKIVLCEALGLLRETPSTDLITSRLLTTASYYGWIPLSFLQSPASTPFTPLRVRELILCHFLQISYWFWGVNELSYSVEMRRFIHLDSSMG